MLTRQLRAANSRLCAGAAIAPTASLRFSPTTAVATSLSSSRCLCFSASCASCCLSSSLSTPSRRFLTTPLTHAPAAATPAPVSFYKRLQVSVGATPEEVKAAYRARALECHPDVVEPESRAFAEVKFRGVSEAYETLSDPRRRRAHDESLGIATYAADDIGAPSSSSAATARRQRQRRSAGYTGYDPARDSTAKRTTTTASSGGGSSSASAKAWRRPYVRGDADKAFASAFEGKSLDQILFEAGRRKRLEAQKRAAASFFSGSGDATASSCSSSAAHHRPSEERAAGHGESVRRAVEHAAERYAQRLQRQYGAGALRNIRASASTVGGIGGGHVSVGGLGRFPSSLTTAPGGHMPFRPFVNQPVPDGVTVPSEPTMGQVLSASDPDIVAADPEGSPDGGGLEEGYRSRPLQFHEHRLKDGTRVSRMESLRRAERRIHGDAHNMGQLYSYQRPY